MSINEENKPASGGAAAGAASLLCTGQFAFGVLLSAQLCFQPKIRCRILQLICPSYYCFLIFIAKIYTFILSSIEIIKFYICIHLLFRYSIMNKKYIELN